MSITALIFVTTRNGVQMSLVVGLPNQYMPLQLTLNTSATILLDSYYIPASSSSSTFRKAVDDPTWFKGYTSNSDLGADYSTGTDYFKLNAVRDTANASQLVLPALLRRDTSEIRAQWDNSGGILGAGPGPALSCPYFTATVPIGI
ncbi:hypothetical protein MVEG_05441 [Podila verticillata NRRL 6337]|nr:hypothetical protein MVEG_05441 [Podila verticillata NRRL 6337]